MSPLKKRVMSSTKSTPWQEVKSNCKDGRGQLLAEACPAGPHLVLMQNQHAFPITSPRWPPQTPLIPFLSHQMGAGLGAAHPTSSHRPRS